MPRCCGSPGLFEQLQRDYRVIIAGPTNLAALLTSFQMGFRSLALQKRSSEVWQLLGAIKKEFETYGAVVTTLSKQLTTASNSVEKLGTRAKVMSRKLKEVELLSDQRTAEKLLGLSADCVGETEDNSAGGDGPNPELAFPALYGNQALGSRQNHSAGPVRRHGPARSMMRSRMRAFHSALAAHVPQMNRVQRAWIEASVVPSSSPTGISMAAGTTRSARTCAEPDHIRRCPLPNHDLRNGRLNQTAYCLFQRLRDVADGDFVGWMDRQLKKADGPRSPDRLARMRGSLIEPLRHVYGVSDKVLTMALSCILLGAPKRMRLWREVGGSMIAIDTLVHNFLTEPASWLGSMRTICTGWLATGPAAAPTLFKLWQNGSTPGSSARYIPQVFPRFVQHAIWKYRARAALMFAMAIRSMIAADVRTRIAGYA